MKRLLLPCLFLSLLAAPAGADMDAASVRTSWLGNTFGYGDGQWVQNYANDLYVSADGTCYTQSIWDDGHTENAFYRDGRKVGHLQDMGGGLAVTGDGQFIFAADGLATSGVVRRFHPDGSKAPFPGGGHTISLPPDSKAYALAAAGGRLFVSDPDHDRVLVYRADDGASVGAWAVARPSTLAAEPDGRAVWIVRFTAEGRPTGQAITGLALPAGLAVVGPDRLLAADAGPNQQVVAFTHLAARPVLDKNFGVKGRLGVRGGVFAGPRRGAMGPGRFFSLAGVGADRAGNVYVSLGGPTPRGDNPLAGLDLRKLTPQGREVWRLQGNEFVDMGDLDPASDSDYYTKDTRYTLDYAVMVHPRLLW